MRYVSYQDRKVLAAEFKPVYTAVNVLLNVPGAEMGVAGRPAADPASGRRQRYSAGGRP
jgi:hypothetical protein